MYISFFESLNVDKQSQLILIGSEIKKESITFDKPLKRLKITEGIYNQSHRNTNPLLTLILNGFEFFRFLENIVIIRSHNSEKQLSVLSNIRELLVISEHVVHSIDFMLMAFKSIFCIYHKNLYMTTNIYIMFARTEVL